MRISDWSSDVCSSDLFAGRTLFRRARHGRRQGVPPALRWRSPSVPLYCLGRGRLGISRPQTLYPPADDADGGRPARKSTRLELQSLMRNSYAVFRLKYKTSQFTHIQI